MRNMVCDTNVPYVYYFQSEKDKHLQQNRFEHAHSKNHGEEANGNEHFERIKAASETKFGTLNEK